MAINKKLIHFTRYAAFKEQLEAGNILDSSIVWIQDANLLYTHGKIYSCGSSEITYREIWYTTEDNTIVTGGQLENSGYIANVYCDGFGRLIFENTPTLISNMFDGSNLTSIILPEGITELPNYLFNDSYDLKSITLPNGLLVIGDGVFQLCESLTRLEIPNTVTHIGENAFLSTGIQELIIPDSVLDSDFICEQLEVKKLIIGKNVSGTISITNCPNLEEVCSKSTALQTLEIGGADALENLTVRLFTETPPATNGWERVATTTSKIIIPTAGWTAYQEAWGDNIQCQLICGGDDIHNSILWVPQNLTEQQKTTIADNIAAESAGSLVRYSEECLDIRADGFYDGSSFYALPTNPDADSYDDTLLSKSMFSNWNTYVTTFTYADIPDDHSAQIYISHEDYWRIQAVLKRGKILIPHDASAGGYITSIEHTDVQANTSTFDIIFLARGNKKITWTISTEARSDGGYDSVIKLEVLTDVYVLPFTFNEIMNSADNEGDVISILGFVDEIDEAINANKTFMVKQDSTNTWNIVFLEFVKLRPYYRFTCIFDQRMIEGKIMINGNYADRLSCNYFIPGNIQDEIANGNSNIYIADFSYEEIISLEDQRQMSEEFVSAINNNKIILVPISFSEGWIGYVVGVSAENDSGEKYFRMLYGNEIVDFYFSGDTLYPDSITVAHFVTEENLKTINGESIVGSGDFTTANIYITEFSYMQVRQVDEQGFRINQDLYEAIINKKIVLVPYELGSTPNYLIMESPYYDSSDGCYFNLRYGTELIECYVPVDYHDLSSNNISIYNTITGVSVNGTSIATSGVANIPAASTSAYGVTKLSSSTSSTSTTLAATASAVKAAYDLANSKGNGTITGITMNGVSKGTSGVVNLGTVITAHQDISGKQDKLVSGTNIKTINGTSLLGSGNIVISGGSGDSSGSGAYSEVSHGTGDTTFTLTPNTFHVWDEVTSLTLTLGDETAGVANEFLFQFSSGSTATTLSLPDTIKWANDSAPTIEANKIYQISVLKGLGSVLEWYNVVELIDNTITISANIQSITANSQYPVASDVVISINMGTVTIPKGESSATSSTTLFEPVIILNSIIPEKDGVYNYIVEI